MHDTLSKCTRILETLPLGLKQFSKNRKGYKDKKSELIF